MKIIGIDTLFMDAGRPLPNAIATAQNNDERVAAHPLGGNGS